MPILFSILSAFYFMSRLLYNKAMTIKFKWKAYDVVSRSQILCGCAMMIVTIINYKNYKIENEVFTDCIIGGILQGIGVLLEIHSSSTGYSGPSSALVSVHPAVQTFLSTFILQQYPNITQIFAVI